VPFSVDWQLQFDGTQCEKGNREQSNELCYKKWVILYFQLDLGALFSRHFLSCFARFCLKIICQLHEAVKAGEYSQPNSVLTTHALKSKNVPDNTRNHLVDSRPIMFLPIPSACKRLGAVRPRRPSVIRSADDIIKENGILVTYQFGLPHCLVQV
jgi:hypothetical protein